MAVLEKLLKTKLPSKEELSKKLMQGKLFIRRAKAAPEAVADAPAEPLAPQPEKTKKPSLAALLQKRKKAPEQSGNGPTYDRIARALRRSQMEAELAAMKPKRVFSSEPELVIAPALAPPPAPAAEAPAPVEPTPSDASKPEAPGPALLSKEEAEALVVAITQPPEPEPAPPPKPLADPRSAAILALAVEAELDISALAARIEQRTGLTPAIEVDGSDLRLSFPDMTLVIGQVARPLSEAELLNLLYPDEEEWQAIRERFAPMTRHITVGAIEPAETLHDLRRRAVLIAEAVVALLDLMPASLGVIWPLGASLIEEADFRLLSSALAEGLEAEAELVTTAEEVPPQAEQAPAEDAQPTEEPAEPQPQPEPHTQAEEPAAPRA